MRKSQIEIQFNWIFVLIVGAILLTFFVTIAARQTKVAVRESSVDFLVNFEKALSGAAATKGNVQVFTIPKIGLNYECTQTCNCEVFTGETRANAPAAFSLQNIVIFSPNKLKGTNALVWSKDWAFPFRATNFIFMSSPEVKYLIQNTTRGREIYSKLPSKFVELEQKQQKAIDKELFNNIPVSSGSYKVRIIFTDGNANTISLISIKDALDRDISAVKIVQATGDEPEKAEFYVKSGTSLTKTGESYLFGEEPLNAAIFAEDLNTYQCQMNRAFRVLSFVSDAYSSKQTKIKEYITAAQNPATDDYCEVHYIDPNLLDLSTASKSFNFMSQAAPSARGLLSIKGSVENQNLDMIKDGCPQIY